MKEITAYQSNNGNIHQTRERAAADDLMSMFAEHGNRRIQSGDLDDIVKHRAKVIPILLQADGKSVPPLLDERFFHLGDWECKDSPTEQCVYTTEIGFDCCIFCGLPEERK